MYLRTKRRVVAVCFGGTCLCLILVFVMNFCDKSSQGIESKESKPSSLNQNEEKYLFATNLLVLVLSAPSHTATRQVIRETWAKHLPDGTSLRFVIGSSQLSENSLSSLNEENNLSKDLLLLDQIKESFADLTRKVLAMLKYSHENIKFNFLLKVDEDSFVRVDKILDELLSKPQDRLYWGFFDGRAHVKKGGKWQEGDYVLCDRYIPYALGGGYVISSDIVKFVALSSEMLQLYKNEDVTLGTWLAPLNVNRVHDSRFDTEYKSRGCYNSYLVTHKKSPEELRALQMNIDSKGTLCKKETRVRLSYNYDWSVPPSQCCERKDPTVP